MGTFLKAEGLVKRFGPIQALRGVDLRLDHGDSLVLLGPNGAGKSTLLGVLAGRIRPDEGQVSIEGQVLGRSEAARNQTGYLAHSTLLYNGLTARENLLFYGRIYGVKDGAERSDEMLHFMGLWERRNDRVEGFSRGMQQRLSIARSLLHDPGLLFLDEPFSGLDLQSSRSFTTTLRKLGNSRRALVVATHAMQVVEEIGNRVMIMDKGRILYQAAVPENVPGHVVDLYSSVIQGGKP